MLVFLDFLNRKGNHLFEILRSLLVEINHLKTSVRRNLKFLMCIVLSFAISRSSEKLKLKSL